jgi:hypothetical protein
MSYEATLVVVMDRHTGEEKERYLTNKRPATKTLDEYLAPAAEYLATVIKPKKEVRKDATGFTVSRSS